MPVSHIDEIVRSANELNPDMIVLLGDYVAGVHRFRSGTVPPAAWGRSLSRLEAPLGKYATLVTTIGGTTWRRSAPLSETTGFRFSRTTRS